MNAIAKAAANTFPRLLAGLVVAGAAWTGPAAAEILITTQEWAPYQELVGGELRGKAVKTVSCALETIGQPRRYEVLPWARAQKKVADGEAQAFFTASRSPERDAYATMSIPVSPQVWRWYLAKGSNQDVTDRANLRAGAVIGSNMATWLEKEGYASTQKLRTTGELIKNLHAGRIDAVLANELVLEQEARETGIDFSSLRSVVHSDKPLGVYFSNAFLGKNPGFLDRFNDAVTACRE